MKDTEAEGTTPPKKTWRNLIGAGGSIDGPTDVAERHDYYLGKSLFEEYGIPFEPGEEGG